ncbi:MAG: SpoIID/LytB domain-containing protein [Leptolyngbya sp. UWPOB_LEPTO1]|uniref:SpoIID/LytB domain-containing protein n=1 Tax=Leptolyngbya sp. UWPOB_LEPTO1 TaxID=2815653 RepID=UPI001ACB1909|nr:SpoIID/LytB domain-containing protein [Leptolyngbya sp. UWPOB_LEPTO1]MBN8562256.1 SpoIID/LytB domain-containing protein [Leptolyngbya sp. UWPOB_LEPTO1]
MALTFISLKPLTRIALGLTCLIGFATPAAAQQDVGIQVGIVQRFGDRAKDTLTLKANPGDRLTVRFDTNGKPETLTAQELKLEIATQSLPEPVTDERVVFSTHRSFESAEDQAQEWRKQGIEVEIAQPERWQVWAKREVYNTPLLRRLLLQSLQAKGIQTARIESRTMKEVPRPTWVINGFRYTRDVLDISSGSNVIQVDREKDDNPNRPYGGALRIQPNAYGNYTLVNFVGIETYLRGVVPHEIGTWAPQPVLEAQAVLARTYALRNIRRFAIDNYQLCATTQCQVYRGLDGAAASTDKAISATRGLVLTYQNELVDAVYSSTSGGVTSGFNDIWHGWDRPYLRTVVDSVKPMWDIQNRTLADERNFREFLKQKKGFNEDGTDMFRWRYEVPMAQLNQELREYLNAIRHPLANFKTIQNIKVLARSNGGRILKSAIITDAGTIELEKDDIQTVFEAPASTLFHVDAWMDKNRVKGFIFTGGGFGHGVGMSQVGSYNLGRLGWSSDRILSFYFPGTQLQPINNSITIWRDHSTEQTSAR